MSVFDGVLIAKKKIFPLHSGGKTNVIFDVNRMLIYPEDRDYCFKLLSRKLVEVTPSHFVGIELGGVPLAAMMAERYNAGFGIFRKDKTHSLPDPEYVASVCIIDDVRTTGNSINQASTVLTGLGYIVEAAIWLIDRDV